MIMGLAGAGKTTVGILLASELGCPFVDADDLQPPSHVRKLSKGQRLDDEERRGWLSRIRSVVERFSQAGDSAVIAFPGLRQADRVMVVGSMSEVRLILLKAPLEVLQARTVARNHRFFNPVLLPSEFALLEEPTNALVLDATQPPPNLARRIRDWIGTDRLAKTLPPVS